MTIDRFNGRYAFLSNFWKCEVEYTGDMYPSLEHAYQAAKTEDTMIRAALRELYASADAKRFGRQIALSEGWDDVKFEVMEILVRDKFTRHAELRTLLLETGDAELIEGNYWHDTIWGRCNCARHNGEGENHLGKTLMKIRQELHETDNE